jgi:hypothetical protein
MRSSRALIDEVLTALEALPNAARTADRLVRDGDRAALDALERLAERLGGAQRHTNEARAALMREREAGQ